MNPTRSHRDLEGSSWSRRSCTSSFKIIPAVLLIQHRALGLPCSILWTQNALNSSALSLSPVGGDILTPTRPIHAVPTVPLPSVGLSRHSPPGSFPAQACRVGWLCQGSPSTSPVPSQAHPQGQGPPQARDKLCPRHIWLVDGKLRKSTFPSSCQLFSGATGP